jgi:hypothetical protein
MMPFISADTLSDGAVHETVSLVAASLMLAISPALAGPSVEHEGPLSPCVQTEATASEEADNPQAAQAWGVEIATAFSEQEALDEFASVKGSYSDLLGAYDPMLVEVCNLSMGTKLQYSARIGTDSREAADQLCAQLRAAGGACIVQKN